MQPSGTEKTLKLTVVTICILFCARQIWNEVSLLQKAGGVVSGFRNVLRAAFRSSLMRSVSIDCIAGALFAALYIYLRRGPSVLGIPISAIAVLCVLFGSFVPLLYIAILLVGERTLQSIAPGVVADDVEDEEKWLQPRVVGGFFLLYFIFDVVMGIVAGYNMSFKQAIRMMFRNVYARTLTESYMQGLCVTALLLVMFEGGNTWWALAWFIAVVCIGNSAACIYAFVTARKAAVDGSTFRKVLLTPGKAPAPDDVSLTTPGQAATYSAI